MGKCNFLEIVFCYPVRHPLLIVFKFEITFDVYSYVFFLLEIYKFFNGVDLIKVFCYYFDRQINKIIWKGKRWLL